MKKLIFTLIVSSLMISTVFTSCTNAAKNAENSKKAVIKAADDLNKAQQAYLLDVQNYRKEIMIKIDDNKITIANFKISMKGEKEDVKAVYKNQIALLEQRNDDMKVKLDAYQVDKKDDWDKFKIEFNHDMDELGKAFKDLTVKNVK